MFDLRFGGVQIGQQRAQCGTHRQRSQVIAQQFKGESRQEPERVNSERGVRRPSHPASLIALDFVGSRVSTKAASAIASTLEIRLIRTVSGKIYPADVTSASKTRGSTLRCNGLYRTKPNISNARCSVFPLGMLR